MDVNVHGEVKLRLELPDALMKLLERCVTPEVKVSVPEQTATVKDAPAKKVQANAVPDTLPEPTVEVKPVAPAKAEPVQTGIAPVAAPQESNLSCDDLRKHIVEARKLARARGNDILSNPESKAKMSELGAAKMTDSCDDLRKYIAETRKLARAHGNDILSNPEIKAKMSELGAAKMTDLTAAQIAEMFAWVDEVSSNA